MVILKADISSFNSISSTGHSKHESSKDNNGKLQSDCEGLQQSLCCSSGLEEIVQREVKKPLVNRHKMGFGHQVWCSLRPTKNCLPCAWKGDTGSLIAPVSIQKQILKAFWAVVDPAESPSQGQVQLLLSPVPPCRPLCCPHLAPPAAANTPFGSNSGTGVGKRVKHCLLLALPRSSTAPPSPPLAHYPGALDSPKQTGRIGTGSGFKEHPICYY